ncbi:MAG: hypothetical protein QOF98_872 [Streptomyces sp.]|nr:hypothetical protein [Streptomyces sp.]
MGSAVNTTTIGVSIAVPEPYGRLLQDRRASFGDPAASAIPTHITLLPPTEVDPADLPAIRRHLARVAAQARAFPIRLAGTDTFRPLTPVVYVSVADGGPSCAELQERIRSGPVHRDLQFPYHPHVTIAHGIPDPAMDHAQSELSTFTAAWTALAFALYEQSPDGVWQKTHDFPFGRPDPHPGVPHQHGSRTATRIS